jgi:DNA-binding transcriptional ArsR family regulator
MRGARKRASTEIVIADVTPRKFQISMPDTQRLTAGTRLTRQAVTKHLRVLEAAGVVRAGRAGRESLFALEPKPIDDLRRYLEIVSAQWDDALARLKVFVEE